MLCLATPFAGIPGFGGKVKKEEEGSEPAGVEMTGQGEDAAAGGGGGNVMSRLTRRRAAAAAGVGAADAPSS